MKRNFVSVVLAGGSLLCPILSSAFLFTLCGPASSDAFSVSIDADQSCFINRGAPDSTYDQTPLQLRNCSEKQGYSNLVTCPLIHFDLSGLPSDIQVHDASLVLTVSSDGSDTVAYEEVGVYPLLSAWNEQSATWNNCPGLSTTAVATILRREVGINTPFAGEEIVLDVTSLVQSWCDGSVSNAGVIFAMTGGNEWGRYLFYDDEADESVRPKLLINYSHRTTVTVSGLKDTYLSMSSPASNCGDSPVLSLRDISAYSAYSNTVRSALLKCDFEDAVSFGAVIEHAELKLIVNPSTGGSDEAGLIVRRCETEWDEHSVCWTNQPLFSNDVYAEIVARSAPAAYTEDVYDITSLVREWQYGLHPNYGLSISFETNTCWGTLVYYSSEWPGYVPVVTISYWTNSFNVKDFGAQGDGSADDTQAILSAVSAANSSCYPSEVFLPKGTYRISSTNEYALTLNGMSDVCLKGEGSNTVLLVSNPENGGIGVLSCTNIVLGDFAVDYDRVPYAQGTITAVDTSAGTFNLQIDSEYLELGDVCFANASAKWGLVVDLAANQYGPYAYFVSSWADLGGRVWRMNADDPAFLAAHPIPVGSRYVHMARQNGHAVSIEACSCVSLKNVDVYAAAGFATHCLNSDYVVIDGLHIERSEGRLLSTNADGIHAPGCSTGLVIQNCSFEGMADDAINIHGRGGVLISNVTETIKRIGISRRPMILSSGDEVQVYRRQGAAGDCTNAVILSATLINDVVYEVTLDRALPDLTAGWGIGDKISNLSRCGQGSLIVSNYFGEHRGRGLLLRSHDVRVEDNFFHNREGWGVALHHEASACAEGPASYNIVINNNLFEGCSNSGSQASIDVRSLDIEGVEASSYDSYNIAVSSNIFTDIHGPSVKVLSASGVSIFENIVSVETGVKTWDSPGLLFGISDGILINGLEVCDLNPETYAAVEILNTVSPDPGAVSITNLTTDLAPGSVDVLDER